MIMTSSANYATSHRCIQQGIKESFIGIQKSVSSLTESNLNCWLQKKILLRANSTTGKKNKQQKNNNKKQHIINGLNCFIFNKVWTIVW